MGVLFVNSIEVLIDGRIVKGQMTVVENTDMLNINNKLLCGGADNPSIKYTAPVPVHTILTRENLIVSVSIPISHINDPVLHGYTITARQSLRATIEDLPFKNASDITGDGKYIFSSERAKNYGPNKKDNPRTPGTIPINKSIKNFSIIGKNNILLASNIWIMYASDEILYTTISKPTSIASLVTNFNNKIRLELQSKPSDNPPQLRTGLIALQEGDDPITLDLKVNVDKFLNQRIYVAMPVNHYLDPLYEKYFIKIDNAEYPFSSAADIHDGVYMFDMRRTPSPPPPSSPSSSETVQLKICSNNGVLNLRYITVKSAQAKVYKVVYESSIGNLTKGAIADLYSIRNTKDIVVKSANSEPACINSNITLASSGNSKMSIDINDMIISILVGSSIELAQKNYTLTIGDQTILFSALSHVNGASNSPFTFEMRKGVK